AALAGELHGACELGRHACLPRHDRLVPRVRPSDLPVALRHALDFMTLAVWPGSRIKGPVFPLEEGDVATVARSRAFLREPRPDLQHWPRYHRIWQGLSSGVSRILPIFGLGLLIGLGLGLMRRDRTSTAALIVGGVIVTRLLLMAMVRAVYIPGAQPYLLCVLPLVPFAGTLGLIALSRRWRRPRLVGIVSVGLTIAVLGLIAWPVPSWLEDLRSLPDGVPRSFWHAIQDEPALVTTHGLLARNDDRLVADPDRSPAYRALRVRLLRRFRQLPTRVRLRGQIHGFQPGTTLFLRWRGADASGLDEGMVQAKPHPDGRFELPMPKALTTLEGFELLISSMSSTSWVVLEPGPIGR
ncbi:MAG: hypothetical protein KDB53_21365, partial [Planctomycetes bacterium]|nr:hypothetical protein [Planctomycetota bacterium]